LKDLFNLKDENIIEIDKIVIPNAKKWEIKAKEMSKEAMTAVLFDPAYAASTLF